MRIVRLFILVILAVFVFTIAFTGCQNKRTTIVIDPVLLQEIRRFRLTIGNNLYEDFVKQRITSMSETSILVDLLRYGQDTIVIIALFDTNMAGPTFFEYDDCMMVNDGRTNIYISDISHMGIMYNVTTPAKRDVLKIRFTDGIFRQYRYQQGNLVMVMLPGEPEETIVYEE